MWDNDLVSVIVPVYKVEKYLERCVCSILSQTYKNIEVILVDDGSPDKSGEICDRLAKEDSRIKVIHKENGGLSSARNAGIDASLGSYIGFVDSDDYISPVMIEKLYRVARDKNSQIAVTGRVDKYEDAREVVSFKTDSVQRFDRKDAVRELLLKRIMDVSACDKLFERELFENIRFPLGETNEDNAVMFKLFLMCDGVAHTDSADYYYCHREESISMSMNAKKAFILNKNVEANAELIRGIYPELEKEISIYAGMHKMLFYHTLLKMKVYGVAISHEEKEILKSSKAFIKKNYKALMENADAEKNLRTQLKLIKFNLYEPVLRLKRLIKGK
jgi:glycosyltransferase involved in cell wall biosynthesis